jgi:hypothetical protein
VEHPGVLYTGAMADDGDEIGTGLAAGLVGVGAGALIGIALTYRPEPRVIFASHF